VALTNPEKSLTGNRALKPIRRAGTDVFVMRPSRAASTSSARPWGEQEIATLQTTTIDQDIQTVVLDHGVWRTRRANGSPRTGRCVPSPIWRHRGGWGAALTYARRYALFTLVGIAGGRRSRCAGPRRAAGEGERRIQRRGEAREMAPQSLLVRFAANRKRWMPPKQSLTGGGSRQRLRDQLLGEGPPPLLDQSQVNCLGPEGHGRQETPSQWPIAGLWRPHSRRGSQNWRRRTPLCLVPTIR